MDHPEAPPSSPLWAQGWYRFAHRFDSPNFGPRPPDARIDLVVLHSISLPPGQYGGGEVQQLFANALDWDAHPYFDTIRRMEVSAHFFIDRRGGLWQFVSCDHRAWHAGVSKFGGRENCNDYAIGIELEGLEGGPFESAQYESLVSVCTALAMAYPLQNIAGHEHVAPGRKADPGAGFVWPALQRALGWPDRCFPDKA
jgi:N-acetyl-anhydromuramoyl-L-alanine amidase